MGQRFPARGGSSFARTPTGLHDVELTILVPGLKAWLCPEASAGGGKGRDIGDEFGVFKVFEVTVGPGEIKSVKHEGPAFGWGRECWPLSVTGVLGWSAGDAAW